MNKRICRLLATELFQSRWTCLKRTTTTSRHVTPAPSQLGVFWQSSKDSAFQPFLSRLSVVPVKRLLSFAIIIGHDNRFSLFLTYLQADITGLAAFEEPLICAYGASADPESGRTRTLWITFLACAFLLPLTIVCAMSAAILRLQRRRHGNRGSEETRQNHETDGRRQRELALVVMASTVGQCACVFCFSQPS